MATNINVNTKYSLAQKYGLPVLDDKTDFTHWEHELEMWQLVTDLDAKKQGPVIYLSLSGKARQACACLGKEELNADNGVATLLTKLRELYLKDKDQAMYECYEKFETFKCDSSMGIRDYINEFERLNEKLKGYQIVLPDAVLAYQLLKNANLPSEKRSLARATLTALTYDNMKKQIKAIHDHITSNDTNDNDNEIKVEPDDVFYGENRNRDRFSRTAATRGRGGFNRASPRRYYNGNSPKSTSNPPDKTGNPSKCSICESIFHWAPNCPDKGKRAKNVDIQLFTVQLFTFASEKLNRALLDSGCSKTVCGENWLKCYMDTLPEDADVNRTTSDNHFKFGDGNVFPSKGQVNIPANIGKKAVHILTDIVDCEIPLLFSKRSMKSAKAKLDFTNDTINICGQDLKLNQTSTGHYCVPISIKQDILDSIDTESNVNVGLTINNLSEKSDTEKKAIAVKLHTQFGHPLDSNQLKSLLRDAEIHDEELATMIETL